MNSNSLTSLIFTLTITTFFSSSSSSSSTTTLLNVTLPNSLAKSLQNLALNTLANQHHTGTLYQTILPENLSGINISVVRLTGKSLWTSGANFNNIIIPSNSVSIPPARRLAIVYQNLGNWSNHWYTVPHYRLITSVLGFKVLDVSNQENVKEITLKMKTHVEISFREFIKDLDEKKLSRVRCVRFKESAFISRMILPGVCYGSSHGDYSVIEPLEKIKTESFWWVWVLGCVLGFGVLGLLGFGGRLGIRVIKAKKIEVMMEKESDDCEVLERRWVNGSKMPSATVTRTEPDFEPGI